MNKKEKLYLLDGSALAYRAYFAMEKSGLTNSEGMPTGAIYAFVNTLFGIINEYNPDYIAMFFDGPEKTFRHEMYTDYKANRAETPDDLIEQIPVMQQITRFMNIPVILTPGFEADDGIGTLSFRAFESGFEVFIVSADKDLMQLLNSSISMVKLGRGNQKSTILTVDDVKKQYGVEASQIPDYLAMLGDKSDNIPGIFGIGKAKAVPLLNEFGTLENILNSLDKVSNKRVAELLEQGKEDGIFSKKLATIKTDIPLQIDFESMKYTGLNKEKLYEVFQKLDFQSLIDTYGLGKPTVKIEKDYKTISSIDEIKKISEEIRQAPLLSVDLETTSINPSEAEIVGVALSWKKNTGVYIPIQSPSKQIALFKQDDRLELLEELKPVLEDESIPKVGQNIKYDWMILHRYNVNLKNIVFDTMVAAFLLHPDMRSYKLDNLSQQYLNYTMQPIEALIGTGKNQITMDLVDIDKITFYAAEDADIALQLVDILKVELTKLKLDEIFYSIELPLIQTLGIIELNGVFVDTEFLKSMSKEMTGKINELAEQIYFEADLKFNINSPKQLSEILFQRLALPNISKGSTAVEVLEKLKDLHPLPALVLEYRKLTKLQNTYLDALPKLLNKKTGRIHSSFNQTIASTGRLSSSNPNFQNIPARSDEGREIRKAFLPQKKGWKIVAADYSQIELRVMAHLSGDPELVKAFHEGIDIHTRTAALVYNIPESEVTPNMRRNAKVVNFGVMYGAGPFRLSSSLNLSMKEAKSLIDQYFITYPGINHFIEETLEYARKNGFVKTISGRLRYTQNINSSNKNIQQAAERMAINMPIQGTAADMIKIAMIRIQNKLLQQNWQAKMILQVHDELIFECPESEVNQLKEMITYEMATALKLDIPVVIDVGVGNSWYEAH
ncbi:MAG: DNA polymerase I [Candidatus Marinimicrobia bacterium]|nr:DNA polymerase I [Candidatus Neomarinimicrobiota bacterium]